MPVSGVSLPTERNLGRQSSVYQFFFDQYTGAAGVPTSGASAKSFTSVGYLLTDGINGAIYWDLFENNVAAGGAIIVEGADILPAAVPSGALQGAAGSANTVWVPVGYYTIIAAGVAQATLTRAVTAVTLTQNTLTRLQILDAYPYMRARVTANASSASLSALVYGIAN